MQNYNHALTSLRGIAAIWVMFFHIDMSLFYRGHGHLLETTFLQKGYLLVDFFFILSGFVICMSSEKTLLNSPHSIMQFYKRRLARIYPLHLFTLFLVFLLFICLPIFIPGLIGENWHNTFDATAFWHHIFLLNAHGLHDGLSWNIASWSLGAEMTAYIFYPFLMCVIAIFKLNMLRISVLIGLSATLYTGLFFLGSAHSLDHTYNLGFVRGLAGFIIGVSLFLLSRQFSMTSTGNFTIRSTAWIGLVLAMYFELNDYTIIPILALLVFSYADPSKPSPLLESKTFVYLGRISFSIYLVHSVVLGFFWFAQPEIYALTTKPSATELICYSLIFIGITLFISHFTYKFIEIPGQKLFNERRHCSIERRVTIAVE